MIYFLCFLFGMVFAYLLGLMLNSGIDAYDNPWMEDVELLDMIEREYIDLNCVSREHGRFPGLPWNVYHPDHNNDYPCKENLYPTARDALRAYKTKRDRAFEVALKRALTDPEQQLSE